MDQKVSTQSLECDSILSEGGKQTSILHDIFTDHSVVFKGCYRFGRVV